MTLNKSLAASIRRYKQARDLTVAELAEDLHLAVSPTQEYLKGNCSPRTDTLELLAERMGVTVGELLASPPPELERTESLMQAAGVLAALKPEKREKAVKLLLELAELIAGE